MNKATAQFSFSLLGVSAGGLSGVLATASEGCCRTSNVEICGLEKSFVRVKDIVLMFGVHWTPVS